MTPTPFSRRGPTDSRPPISIRLGLRIAAARYYPKGRKPDLGLFGSVDAKLGDES